MAFAHAPAYQKIKEKWRKGKPRPAGVDFEPLAIKTP
jgi:hypothetical protein